MNGDESRHALWHELVWRLEAELETAYAVSQVAIYTCDALRRVRTLPDSEGPTSVIEHALSTSSGDERFASRAVAVAASAFDTSFSSHPHSHARWRSFEDLVSANVEQLDQLAQALTISIVGRDSLATSRLIGEFLQPARSTFLLCEALGECGFSGPRSASISNDLDGHRERLLNNCKLVRSALLGAACEQLGVAQEHADHLAKAMKQLARAEAIRTRAAAAFRSCATAVTMVEPSNAPKLARWAMTSNFPELTDTVIHEFDEELLVLHNVFGRSRSEYFDDDEAEPLPPDEERSRIQRELLDSLKRNSETVCRFASKVQACTRPRQLHQPTSNFRYYALSVAALVEAGRHLQQTGSASSDADSLACAIDDASSLLDRLWPGVVEVNVRVEGEAAGVDVASVLKDLWTPRDARA